MGIEITRTYIKDYNSEARHRKHIILLDGTWNDETGIKLDGLVTNIVNLHSIFKNEGSNQIVRYHRGVGNDEDNGLFRFVWRGASGKGLKHIIDRAYARFVQDWQKGDEIFIFGFSRGAAAARLLACKINQEGIPKSIKIVLRAKENKSTKVVEQHLAKYEIENSKELQAVNISFLGVWDTVSAYGIVNVFKKFFGIKVRDVFINKYIAENIERAVHIVSIDETRNPFKPALMNQREDESIEEVWFPGVHSDVGGSYKEDELAKVSMNFMLKRLFEWNKLRGFPSFEINYDSFSKHTLNSTQIAHFHFHGDALGQDLREIGVLVDGKIDKNKAPKIHLLYQTLCNSHEVFSVVKIRKKKSVSVKFQYMPFNVKALNNNYSIVM